MDRTNGQTTDVGLIGSFSTAQQQYVDGLEFDPTTHFLYGCVSDFNDNGALVSIDTTTGYGTLIGVSSGMTDLAFQPDTNILFGVDNGKGTSDGSLYTVDLATGAATLIGHTGNHSAAWVSISLRARAQHFAAGRHGSGRCSGLCPAASQVIESPNSSQQLVSCGTAHQTTEFMRQRSRAGNSCV